MREGKIGRREQKRMRRGRRWERREYWKGRERKRVG